jgi:hypothetical protein
VYVRCLPPRTRSSRVTRKTPDRHGRHPSALLVNGSGPLDRDSAMPGMALGLGRALATALADHGCAMLRCDKRGVGASAVTT